MLKTSYKTHGEYFSTYKMHVLPNWHYQNPRKIVQRQTKMKKFICKGIPSL